MRDLSILAAAREAPDGIALIDDDGACTFEELAARAMDRTAPSQARVLVTPRSTRDDVARLLGLLERRVGFVCGHHQWSEAERADAATRTGVGERRAEEQLLLFTSGSSGRPKVVRLSHGALVAAAAAHAAALPWRAEDRWLLGLPLGHIGGLSILTRSLWARRPVVLGSERFDPAHLLDAMTRHEVTLVSLVPTMLARLLDRAPPRSLRAALLGGAAAAPSLIAQARAAGWPVLPTYGSSETCAQACTQRLGAERETGVGPALPGIEVRVVDERIEIRGPTLMLGYLDDPTPIVDGWYRTGDIGALDQEGHLHVRGRADDTLITGGENVDPREVETALLAHPRITEACVGGRPDPEWGQQIVAMIAGSPAPSPEEVKRHLRGLLAPFKHPKQLRAVDALPRLPSGKVDRLAVLGAFDAPGTRSAEPRWGSE
ncbi:MAG: AMP-binding protein [Sandaracinaceae bacterium]